MSEYIFMALFVVKTALHLSRSVVNYDIEIFIFRKHVHFFPATVALTSIEFQTRQWSGLKSPIS